MSALQRLRIAWTGAIGLPGVTTLYFSDAATALPAVRTLMGNWLGFMPNVVSGQVEPRGDIIDPATGSITGEWTGSDVAPVIGSGGSAYAAPVGFSVTWATGSILDGRRLRGRSYVVPIAVAGYQADGTIEPDTLTNVRMAASAFVVATQALLLVWHRPRLETPAWTDVHGRPHPAKAFRVGGFSAVVSATVADQVAVLTSRRS